MPPRGGGAAAPGNDRLRDLYDGKEFGEWADRTELNPAERRLLEDHVFRRPRECPILDVGTGAGRFLFALHARGFYRLAGVDLSPNLIAAAREKSKAAGAEMAFWVQDATELQFADASVSVILALQQLPSLIEAPERRLQALRECHRVLAADGVLLCSFLDWQGRWFNPLLGALLAPIKLLKGDLRRLSPRYLPWMRVGGRVNFRCLFQRQSYAHWSDPAQARELLRAAGFGVVEVYPKDAFPPGGNGFAIFLAAFK
jgi:ubiquinone/menaquinone biosynthesis C-methylase UbiE